MLHHLAASAAVLAACAVPSAVELDEGLDASADAGADAGLDRDAADAGLDGPALDGADAPPPSAAHLVSELAAAIHMSDVVPGSWSTPVAIAIRNDGGSPSGPIQVNVADPVFGFSIADESCIGTALGAGQACTFAARFRPTDTNPHVTQLRVSATPGGTLVSTLDGHGLAPGTIALGSSSFDFGPYSGTPVSHAFNVVNFGPEPANIAYAVLSGDVNDFDLAPTTCTTTLAFGAGCDVTVRFHPAGFGPRSATVVVAVVGGGSASATVSGVGL